MLGGAVVTSAGVAAYRRAAAERADYAQTQTNLAARGSFEGRSGATNGTARGAASSEESAGIFLAVESSGQLSAESKGSETGRTQVERRLLGAAVNSLAGAFAGCPVTCCVVGIARSDGTTGFDFMRVTGRRAVRVGEGVLDVERREVARAWPTGIRDSGPALRGFGPPEPGERPSSGRSRTATDAWDMEATSRGVHAALMGNGWLSRDDKCMYVWLDRSGGGAKVPFLVQYFIMGGPLFGKYGYVDSRTLTFVIYHGQGL